MGEVARRLLITGVFTVQKCAVHPVSAINNESGEGGPVVEAVDCGTILLVLLSKGTVGSPRHYSRVLLLLRRRSLRRSMIVLLPFIMLSAVASSLCPSFLRLQVGPVWFLLVPSPWDQQ